MRFSTVPCASFLFKRQICALCFIMLILPSLPFQWIKMFDVMFSHSDFIYFLSYNIDCVSSQFCNLSLCILSYLPFFWLLLMLFCILNQILIGVIIFSLSFKKMGQTSQTYSVWGILKTLIYYSWIPLMWFIELVTIANVCSKGNKADSSEKLFKELSWVIMTWSSEITQYSGEAEFKLL